MIEITDVEVPMLDESKGLVLLKLTAPWCSPCRQFDPVLKTYTEETGTPVYNLNIDENPVTPANNAVMSIPTVLVYVDGVVKDKLIGAKPLAKLKKELEPWTTLSATDELRVNG